MRISLSTAIFCPTCECVTDNAVTCDCGATLNLTPMAGWLNVGPIVVKGPFTAEERETIRKAMSGNFPLISIPDSHPRSLFRMLDYENPEHEQVCQMRYVTAEEAHRTGYGCTCVKRSNEDSE